MTGLLLFAAAIIACAGVAFWLAWLVLSAVLIGIANTIGAVRTRAEVNTYEQALRIAALERSLMDEEGEG